MTTPAPEAEPTPAPETGAQKPSPSKKELTKREVILVTIGVIMSGFVLSGVFNDKPAPPPEDTRQYYSSENKSPPTRPAVTQIADAERARQKAIKDEQCALDAQCAFLRLPNPPLVECQHSIERLSTWSFEWTDGLFQFKFTRYLWDDNTRTKIHLAGDRLRFQNGFGAWVDMIYICEVDVRTGQVTNSHVSPGRF